MEEFSKYLTPGDDDKDWGLYLNVAGKTIIPPGTIYPSKSHPSGYYFTWDIGRILHEYQIVYITDGEGIYEDVNDEYAVLPGSLFIVKPGIWHRYKPDIETGWTEYYAGFNGPVLKKMMANPHLVKMRPVVEIGGREEFIESFNKIFDLVKEEKPGFQQVASGLIIKLLGDLVFIERQTSFLESRIERIIQKACFLIKENIEKEIDFKDFADCNNISYSYFRKSFKSYTGLPLAKYQLDLKILRSKELLLSTDKIIKEICFEVGFDSLFYFSRVFKEKVGVSPTRFRTAAQKHQKRRKV